MKKIRSAALLLLLTSLTNYGQMVPLFNQYFNNTMAINPAFAGCTDALTATLGYRNQWAGFSGAPENICFSAHTPLSGGRVGLGMLFARSTVGIYSTTGISGNYAYHLETGQGILSMGLGFTANIYNINWGRLDPLDPADDLLNGNNSTAFLPDFSVGVYYHSRNLFAGISLPEFLSHALNESTGRYRIENRFSEYTCLLLGGYYIRIDDGFIILPSALLRMNPSHKAQADLNAQFIFSNRVWVGAGYRSSNTLTGLLQYQLNYQLRMAYAYDFDLGRVGKYFNGSHEIVLSYVFSYIRKVTGPRQF